MKEPWKRRCVSPFSQHSLARTLLQNTHDLHCSFRRTVFTIFVTCNQISATKANWNIIRLQVVSGQIQNLSHMYEFFSPLFSSFLFLTRHAWVNSKQSTCDITREYIFGNLESPKPWIRWPNQQSDILSSSEAQLIHQYHIYLTNVNHFFDFSNNFFIIYRVYDTLWIIHNMCKPSTC